MLFNKLKILRRPEIKNSFWNISDVIILPFLMLVVTPYFIEKLGPEQYGIWMFVNSIVAGIGLVNMGIGDAAIKFISKYRALEDKLGISRIKQASFSIVLALAFAIILIGVVLSYLIKEINIFNLTPENISIASVSVLLGGIIFALKQVELLLISFFKGYERYDTGSGISIVSKIALLAGQVAVVAFGYQLVHVFLISAITSGILIIGEIIFVKSKFEGSFLIPSYNKVTIKEIFGFSTWSWAQSIMSIIAGHVDRFIVISLAGPAFLAYYALASTIGSQLHGVFTAGVAWIFPKVSAKIERNESTAELYNKMQMLVILAGFSSVAVLLIFGDVIFLKWLGPESYNNSIHLIKIFLYLAFFNMLSIVPYYFFLGSNMIKVSALFMFVSIVFTALFMIICYQFFQYTGLAYGKLFSSMIAIPVMLIILHRRIFKTKDSGWWIKIYLSVALLVLSVYLFNFYSILAFLAGASILWFSFKEKISGVAQS